MPRLALVLVLVLVGCSASVAPAATASASPNATTEAGVATIPVDLCPDGMAPAPLHSRSYDTRIGADGCRIGAPGAPSGPAVQPPMVPTPEVALRANAFAVGTAPALRRATKSEIPPGMLDGFGVQLMNRLDNFRGPSRIGPVTDDEWNSYVWPGPFQKVVRAAVGARPSAGRFFHLESVHVDAGYVLPWNGLQFVDATAVFRDHAEDPPAEGELWYTWHLRLPTTGASVFAIADGHDASASAFMRTAPYWTRSALEQEATSAVAGYLWNESYVAGGNQQLANVQDTTPFWRERIAALNQLNGLFAAGQLTDRHFENVTVRIDRFDPMTFFAGGVVTATISGRLVEVLSGKTIAQSFTQPIKFFRFGSGGVGISGWTAVDAQEDGVWVSGGNLALDKLQTAHG